MSENILYKGFTLWLTGLSGAGKTTLARTVEQLLRERQVNRIEVLDGDIVRKGLSRDLGFSMEDRIRNIQRVGFVCKLLTRNDVPNIAALISPYRHVRDSIRGEIDPFLEVYVKCSLEECEKRDVKGLYQKAKRGELKNFTGVDDPYEAPQNPDIICNTETETPQESAWKVLQKLQDLKLIASNSNSPKTGG